MRSGGTCGIQSQFVNGLNAARLPSFKQFDLKVTKGFGLGGMDLTAYLDVRNVLNFRNVLAVFINTDDVTDSENLNRSVADQLADWHDEASTNGIYDKDTGAIDLNFGGAGVAGCAEYTNKSADQGAVPSCIYLRRVEERWGNGDHLLSLDEQNKIATAAYNVNNYTGNNVMLGNGRRARLGLEINF